MIVLCYVLSFLLSLSIAIHISSMCFLLGSWTAAFHVLENDYPIVVQGQKFTFCTNSTHLHSLRLHSSTGPSPKDMEEGGKWEVEEEGGKREVEKEGGKGKVEEEGGKGEVEEEGDKGGGWKGLHKRCYNQRHV